MRTCSVCPTDAEKRTVMYVLTYNSQHSLNQYDSTTPPCMALTNNDALGITTLQALKYFAY